MTRRSHYDQRENKSSDMPKNEIIKLGPWCNGNIGVSKTFAGSSILSGPAELYINNVYIEITTC